MIQWDLCRHIYVWCGGTWYTAYTAWIMSLSQCQATALSTWVPYYEAHMTASAHIIHTWWQTYIDWTCQVLVEKRNWNEFATVIFILLKGHWLTMGRLIPWRKVRRTLNYPNHSSSLFFWLCAESYRGCIWQKRTFEIQIQYCVDCLGKGSVKQYFWKMLFCLIIIPLTLSFTVVSFLSQCDEQKPS